MSITTEQRDRVAKGKGFIAALDQSGGSTPKALKLYGVNVYIHNQMVFHLLFQIQYNTILLFL